MNRYAFIFDYTEGWMIVLYENGVEEKYFNSAEDGWDNSLDYTNMFVGESGTKYYYQFSEYDLVADIDIFSLENKPIKTLESYRK